MPNIPIFLSSDNNYAPFVATTVASICDNTKSFCEFHILDGGINEENKEKIKKLHEKFDNFSIDFIKIDTEKYFKNFIYRNIGNTLNINVYNRFLISYFFEGEKYIYFDVDIIAKGDVLDLFNENLENYPLGAVKDQFHEGFIQGIKQKLDMNPNSPYFNSGILLVNAKKWRENNLTEKLFEIDSIYKEKLTFADQDTLNKCFEGNYKVLPLKYNVIYNADDTVIRHFAGIVKPWQADFSLDTKNKPFKIKYSEDFWKYAQLTEFYNEIKQIKEKFVNANILNQRYNKIVNSEGFSYYGN